MTCFGTVNEIRIVFEIQNENKYFLVSHCRVLIHVLVENDPWRSGREVWTTIFNA